MRRTSAVALFFDFLTDNLLWFFFVSIALVLMAACSSCAGPLRARGEFHDAITRTEYESSASLLVWCALDPLPAEADPVDVAAWRAQSGARMASAAAISDELAITARHAVACEAVLPASRTVIGGHVMAIDLETYDGRHVAMSVRAIGATEAEDIALVGAVDGSKTFTAWSPLALAKPVIGERVCILASVPVRGRKCGEVSGYLEGAGWMGAGYLLYALSSESGNSGSAVYNEDGEIVAVHVASAGRNGAVGGGFVVDSWRVFTLLDGAHLPQPVPVFDECPQ